MLSQENKIRLHSILVDYYSLEELKTLCFELGFDVDAITSSDKTVFARELVLYLERRDELPSLIRRVQITRPKAKDKLNHLPGFAPTAETLPQSPITQNAKPKVNLTGNWGGCSFNLTLLLSLIALLASVLATLSVIVPGNRVTTPNVNVFPSIVSATPIVNPVVISSPNVVETATETQTNVPSETPKPPTSTSTPTPTSTETPTSTPTPKPTTKLQSPTLISPTRTPLTVLSGVLLNGCAVTTKFGARLQSKPSMQNALTLVELPSNQTYESPRRSDEFPTWFYIVHSEQGGWVSSQFLTVNANCAGAISESDGNSKVVSGCVVKTKFGARLQSKPNMQGSLTFAELPSDQTFESPRRSDTFPTWFYIVNSGQGGWVSSQFLQVNSACAS
ncbi:MAG: hypothetical protein HC853_17690 [Anaerolineae bacterium]|nr:hypothetical protein [Anaerolineae bacterium]